MIKTKKYWTSNFSNLFTAKIAKDYAKVAIVFLAIFALAWRSWQFDSYSIKH